MAAARQGFLQRQLTLDRRPALFELWRGREDGGDSREGREGERALLELWLGCNAAQNRDFRLAQNMLDHGLTQPRRVIVKMQMICLLVEPKALQTIGVGKLPESAKLLRPERLLQLIGDSHECHAGIIPAKPRLGSEPNLPRQQNRDDRPLSNRHEVNRADEREFARNFKRSVLTIPGRHPTRFAVGRKSLKGAAYANSRRVCVCFDV
jgi:hypothetical protein